MPTKPAPKNARRSKRTQERVLAAALRIADKEGSAKNARRSKLTQERALAAALRIAHKDGLAKNARRSKLTQERVLAAALRIADKEGLEALSMRRLAQTLRVEAMSLYNHFANKEAILDRLVEYVTGKVQVPLVGTPWRTAMRMRAISARTVFREHPWAAALSESRSTAGPMRLRLCNAVLAVLIDAGFSLDLAQSAFLTLDSYIYGFALQEASWPIRPEQRQQAIEAFLQVTRLDDFEHVAAAAQSARKSKESGATFYDRQFDFGLELILDGLERARKRTAP